MLSPTWVWRDLTAVLGSWGRSAPGEDASDLLRAFHCFFALKLLATFHHIHEWEWSHGRWLQVLAVLSTVGSCRERFARVGALGWALILGHRVVLTWPYTLNHLVLELILLLLIALHPADTSRTSAQPPAGATSEPARDGRALCSLLWGAMLSVWVFAGLQKIAHGHYLNGESFALAILTEESSLAQHLRGALRLLHAIGGSATSMQLPVSAWSEVRLGGLERAYCLIMSWMVVGAELFLPVLSLHQRTRPFALPALIAGQVLIGWMSDELDFALTAVGVLNLGSTQRPYLRYAILSGLAAFWGLQGFARQ